MTLASRVTVAGVAISANATLSVDVQVQSGGGATNLRLADGSITRQVAWDKRRVTLTCSGWIPPAISAVDWSAQITIIVPAPGGTSSYTGYCDRPQQSIGDSSGAVRTQWTLTLDEG